MLHCCFHDPRLHSDHWSMIRLVSFQCHPSCKWCFAKGFDAVDFSLFFLLNDDLEYLLNYFKCHPSRVWYVPLSLSGRLKSVSDSNNNGNNCPAPALITFPSSLPSQTGGQTTTAMVTDYNAFLSHHSTGLQGKTHHKYVRFRLQVTTRTCC